jgi:hypothetical protein
MKNVNQRRKYSNIKKFNDCCGTALHEATDKFLGDEGAVIRCGGEIDLVRMNTTALIDKNTNRMLRKASRITATKEERLKGQSR